MVYSGHNTFLLTGEETAFGTAASSIVKNLGYIENCNVSYDNNSIEIPTLGDLEIQDTVLGNFDESLSIDGYLNSGAILEMFYGQSTDTATTTDYTHTFVETPSILLPKKIKSYTLMENMSLNSDITLTHLGCKVNTIDISLDTNNVLRFSSEIIGTNVTKATTAGTRTQTTTKPLGGFQGTVSLANTGSTYTDIGVNSSLKVSLNNNISAEDVKVLSSRFNQELVNKSLRTSVSFTQKFANSVEFEKFLGGTTAGSTVTNQDIKIVVMNGITLGSGRIEYYLELSNGQIKTCEINKAFDGVIEAKYEYVGGKHKKSYFVDAVASYY